MLDLHSHILAGLDDGPVDLEGSLAFARAATDAGITTIAATPHANSRFRVGPAERDAALDDLRAAVEDEAIPLEVLPGAEISLARYLDLEPAELDRLRLGDGPYLLLECPLARSAGAFDRFLAGLLERGVPMLLAHPERCPAFQRDRARLEALVARGALVQITADSVAGRFGDTVRAAALGMVDGGLVHNLASDSHDAEHRAPDLRGGLAALMRERPGAGALGSWLTEDAPAAILAGAPLPPRPSLPVPAPRRARWWQRASRAGSV